MCDEEGAEDGEGDWEDVEDESEEDTAEEADMCTDEAANSPTGDEDLDNLKELLEERGVQSVFPDLDGTALYSVLCKINHSCQPNAIVTYECTDKGLAARLTALRDIKPGEELLHSYIDQSMGKLSTLYSFFILFYF